MVDVAALADQAQTMLGSTFYEEAMTGLSSAAVAVTADLAHTDYVAVVDELRRRQGLTVHHQPTANGSNGGTLAELLAKDIPPIRYVVNDLIPEGLTLLAGKPKLGKSWLALGVSLGVCAGAETLGHWTEPGEVLYIALEDGERRMQDRVRRLGGQQLGAALGQFHYRTTWPTLDRGGVDQMGSWIGDHPDTRLIVVDTYGKLQGEVAGRDRYAEEYRLLGSIQTFATTSRIAVVLVHHLRKQSADDWLEQLSGSQAITGAADTLLGLFRERGLMDATLRLVSRDIEETDWALKFDAGRWESMGEAAQYRTTVERSAVLDALGELGGEARTSDIAALIDKTVNATSKLLAGLEKERLLQRVRYGVYALKTYENDQTGEVDEVGEVGEVDFLSTYSKVGEVAKLPTSPTSTTLPMTHRKDLKEDPW